MKIQILLIPRRIKERKYSKIWVLWEFQFVSTRRASWFSRIWCHATRSERRSQIDKLRIRSEVDRLLLLDCSSTDSALRVFRTLQTDVCQNSNVWNKINFIFEKIRIHKEWNRRLSAGSSAFQNSERSIVSFSFQATADLELCTAFFSNGEFLTLSAAAQLKIF